MATRLNKHYYYYIKGAKVPGNENSTELKFRETFVPGSEKAWERKGQGAKVPGSEFARVLLADSLWGANWPGSEKARYLYNDNIIKSIT